MSSRSEPAGEGVVGLSGPRLRAVLESFLSRGQSCRLRVHGSSMTPFIRHGDIAVIEPVRCRLRVGDVVAASDPACGRVVLHRIVKSCKAGDVTRYLLRGDSGCPGEDWIESSMVLGTVSHVSRGHRRVRTCGGLAGRAVSGLARSLCAWRRRRTDQQLPWRH